MRGAQVSPRSLVYVVRPLPATAREEMPPESDLGHQYPRLFRPDIQALRAVAVVLVVLFHAHIPGIHAGFLGVDVFFVISGYVITTVLLQERESRSATSLSGFYGRRIRRILPAATVVLVVTLFAVYHWLGVVSGVMNANDAKWVAAFMGNFHFASTGTQYLTATAPPSALQQYWSLAVEEQFYLVWPPLFIVLVSLWPRVSSQRKLLVGLSVVIAASLAWSIVETGQNQVWAFFSPLTRAWELALGAALAVAAPHLRDRAPRVGSMLACLGYLVIAGATWVFSETTPWPGSAVMVPVLATGAVILGGTLRQSKGFGPVTKSAPVQWFGNTSYSLYLVHWPIIIIASEYALHPLSTKDNVLLILASVTAAAISYYLVENPIRRLTFLKTHKVATFAMGAGLIGVSYAVIYLKLGNP